MLPVAVYGTLSVCAIVAVLAMDHHDLFFDKSALHDGVFCAGPLLFAWQAVAASLFLFTGYLYVREARRRPGSGSIPYWWLAFVPLAVIASNAVYYGVIELAGITSPIDPTPIAATFTIVVLLAFLVSQRILERMSYPRRILEEKTREGVVVIDPDGRAMETNPAAEEMLGLRSDGAASPLAVAEIGLDEAWRGAQRSGRVRMVLSRGGRTLAVSGSTVRFGRAHAPAWGILFLRDISEAHSLQEKLKEAYARLQDLDAAKANVLSSVSHELRTPLVSIRGYVELLADGGLGPVRPRQREALSAMQVQAERLVALIDTLLGVVRAEAKPPEARETGTGGPGKASVSS
jgi:signal transduction histidine kinase